MLRNTPVYCRFRKNRGRAWKAHFVKINDIFTFRPCSCCVHIPIKWSVIFALTEPVLRGCFFFSVSVSARRRPCSRSSKHPGARGGVREEGQHHQPHVLGERALDAAQLGGVAPGHQGGGLRLATRPRRHQPGDGEDRVGHHQQVAGHQGRAVRHRQLHVPAEQREHCYRIRPRAQRWVQRPGRLTSYRGCGGTIWSG